MSFATITLYVASQRVFVVIDFVTDSVRKRLDIPSYICSNWLMSVIYDHQELSQVLRFWRRWFQIDVFWIVTPRCVEDGDSTDLWKVGILPQHYTASQPRRPRLEKWCHIKKSQRTHLKIRALKGGLRFLAVHLPVSCLFVENVRESKSVQIFLRDIRNNPSCWENVVASDATVVLHFDPEANNQRLQ
jgi:hypothetical protein